MNRYLLVVFKGNSQHRTVRLLVFPPEEQLVLLRIVKKRNMDELQFEMHGVHSRPSDALLVPKMIHSTLFATNQRRVALPVRCLVHAR